MNSLSSATLLLGELNFFFGGGDLFLFLTISTKRELLKITPKKISVYVKYQLFSWGGNKESNMTQVTPRKRRGQNRQSTATQHGSCLETHHYIYPASRGFSRSGIAFSVSDTNGLASQT